MVNTLVVIGHHTEESEFGDHLRRYIESHGPAVLFHKVKNSYQNGSSGHKPTAEEIKTAEEEILHVMTDKKPDVTIDVHTGTSPGNMCMVELIALNEYEKLQPIRTADRIYPVDDCWATWINKFQRSGRVSTLHTNQTFPFVALEAWLDPTLNKPPYSREVEFAAHVIQKVAGLY